MTIEQKLEVIENAVIDWKKRLDTIRENISAFSDYLDETNQLGAIDDKAWDYLVNIEKAKLVLQEPIFVEAIETLKKLYSQSLLNTGVNEQDAREKLWLAFQIVQKVEHHFIEIMETGKLAKKQLEDFRASIEKKEF